MVPVKLSVRVVEGVQISALLPGHVTHARHMRSGKKKLLGIHVSGFHEALRLLRTAARVRFVDQTALVVQKAVEVAPGARKLLAKILATDVEELRPDNISHTENLAKDVDQPLLAIEA